MRNLIIKLLLRLLGREHYNPLSKDEVDSILIRLSNEEGLERFPDFLQQCADQYRNQFMYTGDASFRGTVLAFVALRERIMEKKGKNLTKKEKSVKIKEASY
jgi:hypothetical protein